MRVLLFLEGGGVGKRESWHILCQKLAISPELSVDRGLLKLLGGEGGGSVSNRLWLPVCLSHVNAVFSWYCSSTNVYHTCLCFLM